MLSSVLKNAGHTTRLVFLPSDSTRYSPGVLDETRELVSSADLIGFSCHSRGSSRARQLIAHLRDLSKPIVWGGLHATLNPADAAQSADMVCRGEGEETILELADAIESGRDWEGIRNLAFLKQGRLIVNPVRPPIANLDRLPLFDFERQDEFHLGERHVARVSLLQADAPPQQVCFIGSRGCALHCTYCCNRSLKELYAGNGKYLRRMSAAKYVEHLETMYRTHFPNATDFFLLDEDFFMRSAAELREFSRLYRERIGIPFECMCSPLRVTAEKMEILVQAGLWRLRVGVESGSERTKRQIYDRNIPNDAVLAASRTLKKFSQVIPLYFFIIGNPYEEQGDLTDTLRLLTGMAYPFQTNIYNLVFFPGSALYERAVADGTISGDRDSGWELDFLGGFRYQSHVWKQKNLYLNALLCLVEGKTTKHRLGMLPRLLIPLLIHPRVIQFVEPRKAISRAVIAVKACAKALRGRVGGLVRKVVRDPAEVYSLSLYLQNSGKRALARCSGALQRAAGYSLVVSCVRNLVGE